MLAVGATARLSLRTTGGCFRGKGEERDNAKWSVDDIKTRGGTTGNPLVFN